MQEITTLKFYEYHNSTLHHKLPSIRARIKGLRDNNIKKSFGYTRDIEGGIMSGKYDYGFSQALLEKIGKTRKYKEARDQFYRIFGVDCGTEIKSPRSIKERLDLLNQVAIMIDIERDLKGLIFGHREPSCYLSSMSGGKYGIIHINI